MIIIIIKHIITKYQLRYIKLCLKNQLISTMLKTVSLILHSVGCQISIFLWKVTEGSPIVPIALRLYQHAAARIECMQVVMRDVIWLLGSIVIFASINTIRKRGEKKQIRFMQLRTVQNCAFLRAFIRHIDDELTKNKSVRHLRRIGTSF